MTLEQCTTSLDKVNKKRKYRTTIFCGTIMYAEIVISREKIVHVKVIDISCEFKIVYLILMLPKNFGDYLPTLENILSNNPI